VVNALDKLRMLDRYLDEDQPPPEGLYVAPSRAVVTKVVGEIRTDAIGGRKHLLFGARGCGKSTQLTEISRALKSEMTAVEIDLDRTGVSIAGITALDLLYTIAVAVLKEVVDVAKQEALFRKLAKAYGGKDSDSLGKAADVMAGISGFATNVTKLVGTVAIAAGAAPVIAAGAAVGAAGIRLMSNAGVVSASSPKGREVQEALAEVLRVVRESKPPIVILIDGLEKVNGGAAQWFRDTFENTRLLLDVEAVMVVACPPCPFTDTNSAHQFGYVPQVVWGFSSNELPTLQRILSLRVDKADIDSATMREACERFSNESGGHPRHAIMLLRRAVKNAILSGRSSVSSEDCDAASQEIREWLVLGLNAPAYAILRKVERQGILTGDDLAGRLFADGRILASPPDASGAPGFMVHPLLKLALARFEKVEEND
jgi:Cdc6-like AAA superfamily ATPase